MTDKQDIDDTQSGLFAGQDPLPLVADAFRLVVRPLRAMALSPDGELLDLSLDGARDLVSSSPVLIINRALAARRLGLRGFKAFDVLELFAFVRPARFCLPTAQGLAESLTLDDPGAAMEDELTLLDTAYDRLIADLSAETYRYRSGAKGLAMFMARGGWPWGPAVLDALNQVQSRGREEDGFAVWLALKEWEDQAPPPPAGDEPIDASDSVDRLAALTGEGAEDRPGQRRYASAASYCFTPRQFDGGPNIQLLEAGTGTGKTLGYLAPASLWAEANKGPVWLATFTKALQRQLDSELDKLYPDPREKKAKAVIRKGRENYLCLLNLEETARAVMARLTTGYSDEAALIGLVLRWARYSRDGDMIGGDFPSWLGGHFGAGRVAGLTDRRGECIFSACPHYGKCFVEKATRSARHADLVVANHALFIAQAVNRAGDPDLPKRLVLDEGHHLFDSADSAFAVALSGLEGAELRRWLRGKESGGSTRARGLKKRLEDLIGDHADLLGLLEEALEASRLLPGEGWQNRVTSANPYTAYESFLTGARAHIFRRTPDGENAAYGLEAPVNDLNDRFVSDIKNLAEVLIKLEKPLFLLAQGIGKLIADNPEDYETGDRARLENIARSVALRADQVGAWRSMLKGLWEDYDPQFVTWFSLDRIEGRERDIGLNRHFLDPTEPLAKAVLTPLHGVLVTSATLRDHAQDKAETVHTIGENQDQTVDWQSADIRSGTTHLDVAPRRLSVPSPFDYRRNTRILIVNDLDRGSPDQVAGAIRDLSLAAGGGVLALFTAIQRLRQAYTKTIADFEQADIPLYAQHIDPIDVATLVDMFRREEKACLFGTDAVRDGVDVPGNSLRMILYDRVPWPRPTLLHKARRDAFGGKLYDDMQTRLKIAQAYGRLVRRQTDRGLFVMLDGRTPSRLLEALPSDVDRLRLGIRDAIGEVKDFFKSE